MFSKLKFPLLGERRAFKRQSLLQATECELEKIVQATKRSKRCLKGKDKIGVRVGKVLGRFKVAKHFDTEILEGSFSYKRNTTDISEEFALNGIYVIRTSVSEKVLDAKDTVRAPKPPYCEMDRFTSLS